MKRGSSRLGMTAALITNLFSLAPSLFFFLSQGISVLLKGRYSKRNSKFTHHKRYLYSTFGEGQNMSQFVYIIFQLFATLYGPIRALTW